jgi:hypothetical protein
VAPKVRQPIDVAGIIEQANKDRDTARADRLNAESRAASKKATDKQSKNIQAQANNKFAYAKNLETSLNNFEDQLTIYATKISRGDELTGVEEKDFKRIADQYNKTIAAYNKATTEGSAILAKLPEQPPEDDAAGSEGMGDTPPITEKEYLPVSTVPISEFLTPISLDKNKTKELQVALKSAGPKIYDGPTDGVYRASALIDALERAEREIGAFESTGFKFKDRYDALVRLASIRTSGDGTGGATTTISPKATATTYIDAALKAVGINRNATPEEINSLTKILNDAENRFRTTTKGGVTRDLLGNRQQFIENLITTGKYVDPNTGKPIKGIKEDVKKASKVLGTLSKSATAIKADTRSLSVGTIKSTANANGISLSPQQLDQYALDIQNGKDIKVIQNEIRSIAGAGMPENIKKLLAGGTNLDVVYAPYKTQMAAILEVNPETINFTDPALRGAIGPTGEMSIYDFQRALRKDARWQYTNNAREDVFQSVGKVLQDFGFQG